MSDFPWVMVDLETTGLYPSYHDICEIGAVRSDGLAFSCTLPFDPSLANPAAMQINRYDERKLNKELPYELPHYVAAIKLAELFDHPKTHIVAWPAMFDVAFLTTMYHRLEIQVPWHYRHVIDVRSFASGLWGVGCDLTDEWAWEVMQVDRNQYPEHTALGDAQYQAELFTRILTRNQP